MANSEVFSLTISSSINPLFLKRGVLMLCEIYHYRQYFLTKKSANGRSQNEKEIEICAKYLFFCKKKCTNNQ